jgi:hypothetical protein
LLLFSNVTKKKHNETPQKVRFRQTFYLCNRKNHIIINILLTNFIANEQNFPHDVRAGTDGTWRDNCKRREGVPSGRSFLFMGWLDR